MRNVMITAAFTAVMTHRLSRPALSFSIDRFTTRPRFTGIATKSIRQRRSVAYFSATSKTEGDGSVVESPPAVTDTINNRISRGDLESLDARTVTENLDLVKSHLVSRRASADAIASAERVASLNGERVALIQKRDVFLAERNKLSEAVGKLMRQSKDRSEEAEFQEELEAAKSGSSKAASSASLVEEDLDKIESSVRTLLASLPNLLDDVVPDGNDDEDNLVVSTWGEPTSLPAETKPNWPSEYVPLWHDDVASNLNGWKADQAVAISGARFVALSGKIARLERAISSFLLDLHTDQHGYEEYTVPYVVSRTALEGTGQLPKFEEDLFKITPESHTCNGEDAYLIPTAEVPLTNLYRDSILEISQLPMCFVAKTPCFRAEAGSYGRDTRGLIRTHQFEKVELVKITTPEDSHAEHEKLTRDAERCLELLELPYRKVRLCSGDIGFSARHCYDLEVWLPGENGYREISSCSNTGDFQARKMGLRYRPNPPPQEDAATNKGNKKVKKKKVKPQFCHTINGSGLAVGRTLVAVLENYQMPDGSVVVPEVLRPYMGGLEILKPDE